jgi:hypothetical protein
MHEAHKMLLQELKANSPSPDAIERLALVVKRTSQDVVAAMRADAILNPTTGANADVPAFAFLLVDAEYHEAVVRVLQVHTYTHKRKHTHTHSHTLSLTHTHTYTHTHTLTHHEAVVRVQHGAEKGVSQVVLKAVLEAYGNLARVGGVRMYEELINTQGMLEGNRENTF